MSCRVELGAKGRLFVVKRLNHLSSFSVPLMDQSIEASTDEGTTIV